MTAVATDAGGREAGGGPPATPFDALAAGYDESFTKGMLGGMYRRAVMARVEPAVGPGDRVLDLGCGTGEDALHLARLGARVVAVDASAAMVAEADRKATLGRGRPSHGSVDVRHLPAELVGSLSEEGPFDLVLSNFGVLNCVDDPGAVARGLARCTRPGARVFLCVMGPVVPWEWGWFLVRGRAGRAFRRLRPGGVTWRGMRVRYPGPGRVRRAFARDFRADGLTAVGALLPPSYAEAWAVRHRDLVARLDRWERRLEGTFPLPLLADHYLLSLVRR